MGYMTTSRVTQFSYFSKVLGNPDWRGRKILDFGGNVGGFLVNSGNNIDHNDYWCIDLSQAAITEGRSHFPNAHFVHYNRYSAEFNPEGTRNLAIPDCGLKFDIILAFSVFTHTHPVEMFELLQQLQRMLHPQGVIAFTFTDPSYDKSLTAPTLTPGTDVRKHLVEEQIRHPSLDIEEIVEQASQASWCLLIDEKLYIEPGQELSTQERQGKPWESYCSYFSVDYMASLFPNGELFPPVSPDWQHCCVLRNSSI